MPMQIPGIELEYEIGILGLAVTILPRNSDAEMAAAAANAGFTDVSAAKATPAVENIVIDDNFPVGDAVAP